MMEIEEALSDCEYTLDISEEEAEVEEVVLAVSEEVTNKPSVSCKSKDPIVRVVEDADENTTNSTNSLDIDLNDRAHLITETFMADDFDDAGEFDERLADDAACKPSDKTSRKDRNLLESHLNSETSSLECSEKQSTKGSENSCNSAPASPLTVSKSKVTTYSCTNSTESNGKSQDGSFKNDRCSVKTGSKSVSSNSSEKVADGLCNQSTILVNGNVDYPKNAVANGALNSSLILSKKKSFSELTFETPSRQNGSVITSNEMICDKSSDTPGDLSRNNGFLLDSVSHENYDSCPGTKKRKVENSPNEEKAHLDLSPSDHSVEKYSKLNDTVGSNIVSSPNADAVGFKRSLTAKKNIARKHTSSIVTSKVLKDLESTVRKEMKKCDEKIVLNGDLVSDLDEAAGDSRDSMEDETHGTVAGDHKPFKVSLPIDNLGDASLKSIFKTMRKTLSRRQLEEIVLQKVCEMISDSSEIGELKKQISELQQAETHRKQTCFDLKKQVHQLKGVCQVFLEKVKNVKDDIRFVTPTVITRSVGLQVAVDSSPYVLNNADTYPVKNNSTSPVSSTSSPRTHLSPSSSPTPQSKATDSKSSSSCTNEVGSSSLPASFKDCSSTASSPETTSSIETNNPSSSKAPSKSTTPVDVDTSNTAIIDLTDKDDKIDDPLTNPTSNTISSDHSTKPTASSASANPAAGVSNGMKTNIIRPVSRHPAPLPPTPNLTVRPGMLLPPPKPELRIFRNKDGISLSWNMPLSQHCAKISKYQIYAYQETTAALTGDPWKPVGDVDALPLPMECTLTQFFSGYRYHFTVRAIDEHMRIGPFSTACSIAL